ncbi:hypothetical protein NRB56_71470 [Nocardia sp. RB56]|uniref:Uncharacterized protein n=1 Tax=Nocardia aurantia TaxID=2585199 RepID=A0A7K0E172_9NOCA|nr:hypothetical protein [Nocardia aurantia]
MRGLVSTGNASRPGGARVVAGPRTGTRELELIATVEQEHSS